MLGTDGTAGAGPPRIKTCPAGDQMEDIVDEDGEEQSRYAEQLDIVPDETVPRLEVVVSDIFVGGLSAFAAQHKTENCG